MELRAIMVAIITIYSGLFYLTKDIDEVTEILLFIVILIANAYFILLWLKAV
jgi:hypothetical protein